MIESAVATWAIASMRAVCRRVNPCAAARRSRPSFHCRASWSVQNSAWVVCSGVLMLLPALPIPWISLTSRAYAALLSAKGGPGRNCDALRRTSGRTPGRRSPAAAGGVVAGGAARGGGRAAGAGGRGGGRHRRVGLPDAGAGRRRVEVGERRIALHPVVRAPGEHASGDEPADRDP